jgi:hypothetical protein
MKKIISIVAFAVALVAVPSIPASGDASQQGCESSRGRAAGCSTDTVSVVAEPNTSVPLDFPGGATIKSILRDDSPFKTSVDGTDDSAESSGTDRFTFSNDVTRVEWIDGSYRRSHQWTSLRHKLDDSPVVPTPEPRTVGLTLLGLLLLLVTRKRITRRLLRAVKRSAQAHNAPKYASPRDEVHDRLVAICCNTSENWVSPLTLASHGR